jgi:hypothetical protein
MQAGILFPIDYDLKLFSTDVARDPFAHYDPDSIIKVPAQKNPGFEWIAKIFRDSVPDFL